MPSPATSRELATFLAELEPRLGRLLDLDEHALCDALAAAYDSCRALGRLDAAILGNATDHAVLRPLEPDETVPPSFKHFLLRLTQLWDDQRQPLPPFLEPVRARALPFVANVPTTAPRTSPADLAAWSVSGTGEAARAADFRLIFTPAEIRPETRAHGAALFQSLSRTEFERLLNEFDRGALEVEPVALPIWLALARHARDQERPRFALDDPAARRMLNPLVLAPDLHTRLLTPQGAPLFIHTEPLAWRCQLASAEPEEYDLILVGRDGHAIDGTLAFLPGRRGVFLGDGIAYLDTPFWEAAYSGPIRLPAATLASQAGTRLLHALRCTPPASLQSSVTVVAARVSLSARLARFPNVASPEALVLDVVAGPDGELPTDRYTHDGWRPLRQLTAVRGRPVHYDRSRLDRFELFPETLGLRYERFEDVWFARLRPDFAEQFRAWTERFPPEINLELDDELQSLFEHPTEAQLELNLKPAEEIDWFDLQVVIEPTADTALSRDELRLLLEKPGEFVRIPDKGWHKLQLHVPPDRALALARLGLSPEHPTTEDQRMHILQLADLGPAQLPLQFAEPILARANNLLSIDDPHVPPTVKASLRPYQVEGFRFLARLAARNLGGILADDMGLGKTLQTLSWLAWLRHQPSQPKLPSLVVCPKSVVDNWIRESAKFTPHLRVAPLRQAFSPMGHLRADLDLLVVNYAQLRARASHLTSQPWLAVILDEAQHIKNPQSQTSRTARSLDACHRIAVSGTPIENHLMDLWSLLQFAMPGVLGTQASFAAAYGSTLDAYGRERLAARIKPFLLRRTKREVAPDLPERIEEDLLVEFEPDQETLYRAELKRAQQILLEVESQDALQDRHFNVLQALLRLRQVCCHPALLGGSYRSLDSAKVQALLDLAGPLIEEGHKLLVFSQFVTMLELLRAEFVRREWPHYFLTGETQNRGDIVEAFQNDPNPAAFFLSLRAAGSGITLTAASYVVLFDPWWNPAVEAQAIDRTHRIGQKNQVIAYRLLAKNSVEEKIRQLQKKKQLLADAVIGSEAVPGNLTLDDVRFLLTEIDLD